MFNQDTHSLVLKCCYQGMTVYNKFKWPTSGLVECTNWDPVPCSSTGLIGWLYGHGDSNINNFWDDNITKWLVVSVETSTIVDLDGKVKFPKGEVVFCGDRKSAIDFLMKHEPRSLLQPIIGASVTVGDEQTVITGDYGSSTSGVGGKSISGKNGGAYSGMYGKSTSGDFGISTSGIQGTSISGNNGTSTSGNYGTAESKDYSQSFSGNFGTSKSGDYSTSIGGISSTVNSKNFSTSFSGDYGISSSGHKGISISGCMGKCKSGINGIISIIYYDDNDDQLRIKTGYIGQDDLKPDTFYCLDENFNFVECD